MYFAVLVITAWLLFVCVPPAFAYLDPGSGSMIVQLLLGGVAGVAVLIRLYWHRLLVLIRLKDSKNDGTA
jgi:hypothetical protein